MRYDRALAVALFLAAGVGLFLASAALAHADPIYQYQFSGASFTDPSTGDSETISGGFEFDATTEKVVSYDVSVSGLAYDFTEVDSSCSGGCGYVDYLEAYANDPSTYGIEVTFYSDLDLDMSAGIYQVLVQESGGYGRFLCWGRHRARSVLLWVFRGWRS